MPQARPPQGEPSAVPDEEEPAPSLPSPACGAAELAAAAEADARMRERSACDPEELDRIRAAVRALDACAPSPLPPAQRWVFPVSGVRVAHSVGGVNGSGYVRPRRFTCYAAENNGHPAHDLFVPDGRGTTRDRDGKPFFARAVESGAVLVARRGWTRSDPGKGGNYVLLYLPARRRIAYYAHLDEVFVQAGDWVSAGQALGTVGRTGQNATARRSPTHLHFGFWDAETLEPVNSYPLLRQADDRLETRGPIPLPASGSPPAPRSSGPAGAARGAPAARR